MTGFSVVLSSGNVIVVNDGLNSGSQATGLQTIACSSNSSSSKRGLRKVENEFVSDHRFLPHLLDSRQAASSGGADVILDVVNVCNEPVTGLSPPIGTQGNQGLAMSCAIAPNQNAGGFE
jgi:hypothetical protein